MLKKLAKRINKELEQARDYCEQAYLVKDKSRETSELFYTLSGEEINHAEKLIREGKRLVEEHKVMSYDKDEIVDSEWHEKCKVIWEWERRIALEEILDIKYKLQKYKEMV